MALKRFYQILSIVSAVFGFFLIFHTRIKILGAVAGLSNVPANVNIGFGIFFLIAGIVLFGVQYFDRK